MEELSLTIKTLYFNRQCTSANHVMIVEGVIFLPHSVFVQGEREKERIHHVLIRTIVLRD